DATAIFNKLGQRLHPTGNFIHFRDALQSGFMDMAAGFINNCTLIQDNFIITDCSFKPGRLYDLDKKLINISAEMEILCYGIDEITGGLAYSVYKNGMIEKRKSIIAGKINFSEEKGVEIEEKSPEQEIDLQNELFEQLDN